MKRVCLPLMIITGLLMATPLLGEYVPPKTAERLAINWMAAHSDHSKQEIRSWERLDEDRGGPVLYYIFNMTPSGWIIVSADDDCLPVIGYSPTGEFRPENLPPAMEEWLDQRQEEISHQIMTRALPHEKTTGLWLWYSSESGDFSKAAGEKAVAPLMSTTWNQTCYYNADCPEDDDAMNGYCGRVPVGCVATAMAQVMKYHAHPANGRGSHSYTHSTYGLQEANFGLTTYNWAAMPNSLSSAHAGVAQLSYHCGVSVNMNYGPTGSGASMFAARNALVDFFRYDPAATNMSRPGDTASWISTLKNQLDNGRPIIYSGSGTGGHAFIFDGYNNSNFFHVNWGWGGYEDNYFSIDDLTPGSMDFNSGQAAMINIYPSDSCETNVTYPNGGQVWYLNTSNNIFWNTGGGACGDNVKIELYKGAVLNRTLESSTPNDGSYSWTIPADQDLGADFRIKVTELDSNSADLSDSTFTISGTPQADLAPYQPRNWDAELVVSPGSGNNTDGTINVNQTAYLDWAVINDSAVNVASSFYVEIWDDTTDQRLARWTVSSLTAGYYSYYQDFPWTFTASGWHNLRLVADPLNSVGEANETNNEYVKEVYVTPAASCEVTVTSPNGGESYLQGASTTITWTSDGAACGANVKIELYKGGSLAGQIISSTANDGSYPWTIPGAQTPGSDYTIRVTDLTSGSLDTSNGNFSINATPTCSVSVNTPNGGETLYRGTTTGITWSSGGSACGSNIRIDLYKANSLDSTIAASTTNDGNYSWAIPAGQFSDDDYKVRVTDLTSGSYDSSNGNFYITDPPFCDVTVAAPNGGETWYRGSTKFINWSSSGGACGAYVRIDLYKGGVQSSTLTASTPNDGSFAWVIPETKAPGSDYSIRISDPSSGSMDFSDDYFTIATPPVCDVQVGEPDGGESWYRGTSHNITWSAEGGACGSTVRIDLFRGTALHTTITTSTPNDGLYPWSIPPDHQTGDNFSIKVTDNTSGSEDDSNQPFSIICDAPGTFNPTAPSDNAVLSHDSASVNLAWTESAGAEEYLVYFGDQADPPYLRTVTSPGTTVDVSEGGAYFWKITARNQCDETEMSNGTREFSVDECPEPEAPSGLSATPESISRITLAWTDNADNEDGFHVERSEGVTKAWARIASLGPDSGSYADDGLARDTGYAYRVVSFNQCGNSAYSNVDDARTLDGTPVPPDKLEAMALACDEIGLSWRDLAEDETGYRIQRKSWADNQWAEVASLPADTTCYLDSGLAWDFVYTYRVSAMNSYGDSDWSGTDSTRTYPDCQLTMPYQLSFPRIMTADGWQTRLGIVNPRDREAFFRMTAYSAAGIPLAESDVILLAARHRSFGTLPELLPSLSAKQAEDVAWVEVTSFPGLHGFIEFTSADGQRQMLDKASYHTADILYVPHIGAEQPDIWWSEAGLVTANESSSVTFISGENQMFEIPEIGSDRRQQTLNLNAYFDSESVSDQCVGQFESTAWNLSGMLVFGTYSDFEVAAALTLKNRPDRTLYYTHVAWDEIWWTGITVYNPNETDAILTVKAYAESGEFLGSNQATVDPQTKRVGYVSDFIVTEPSPAYVVIESDQPVIGFELFGGMNSEIMAGYNADGNTGPELYFNHVRLDGDFWTGVSIINFGEQETTVTATGYNDAGEIVATGTFPLAPRQKHVRLVADLFPGSGLAGLSHLRVEADQPLAGFEIIGNGLTTLAAMPAVLNDFDADQDMTVDGAASLEAAGAAVNMSEGNLAPYTVVALCERANDYRCDGQTILPGSTLFSLEPEGLVSDGPMEILIPVPDSVKASLKLGRFAKTELTILQWNSAENRWDALPSSFTKSGEHMAGFTDRFAPLAIGLPQ